jgi:hypothetical protein
MWAKYNANGYPCCRWTCPQKGNYSIVGWFAADGTYGGNTFVYVITNGSIMFSNHVASSQSSPPPVDFINPLASLNQGDVLDFTLAWDGENGGLYTGWTAVEAIITLLYPHAATATAVVTNGFVVGAPLTDPGFGYTNTPGVRIIGGGGTGAQAVAVVSNGLVIAVNIANPASGYTATPVIVIAPPFIPQPTMGITALSELSFTNLTAGTNYQLQSFVEGNLSDVGPPFTATNSTFTQLVSGNASTNGYRLAAAPVASQAQATAQVAGGFVVGFTITSGGSGYLPPPAAPPTVTVSGIVGAGSNAVASASVSGGGMVTNVSVVNTGGGYVNGATVVIAPPPATVVWPYNVTQVMELTLGYLSPYDSYQLEFAPAPGVPRSDLGSPFTPTSITDTLYVNVAGNAGFFRLKYLGH